MKKICWILFVALLFAVPAQAARWTFLVYLDGDNNLEAAGVDDVNEMEQVGSTKDVNVVVLFDRARGYDRSNGDWTSARIARIVKDQNEKRMTSFETGRAGVADWGELNMGDPNTLVRFVRYGMKTYPAEKYAVILWNHGGGWRNLELMEQASRGLPVAEPGFQYDPARHVDLKLRMDRLMTMENSREICSDDSSNDVLFTRELRAAFEKIGRKIDLIGMDACLMGMVEVAYELREWGDVMAGSQETEPAFGWPYHYLLPRLVKNPAMGADDLGRAIVDSYKAYCDKLKLGRPPTQSAIRLAEMDNVARAVNRFVGMAAGGRSRGLNFIEIRNRTPKFYKRSFIDYQNFLGLIPQGRGLPASELKNALARAVIHNYSYKDGKATGLSVFFPPRADGDFQFYHPSRIQFAKDTLWDDFLAYIHKQTPIPGLPVVEPPPEPDPQPTPNPSSQSAPVAPTGPTVEIERVIASPAREGAAAAESIRPGDTVWIKAFLKASAMPPNHSDIVTWGMFGPGGEYLPDFERLQIEESADGNWVLMNRVQIPAGMKAGKYYAFCNVGVFSAAPRKVTESYKVGAVAVGAAKAGAGAPRIQRSVYEDRKKRLENQGRLLIMHGPPSGIHVKVAVNKPGEDPQYHPGDSFKIGIKPTRDAYIALLAGQTEGSVAILFPDAEGTAPKVAAGEITFFPPKGRGSLSVAPPGGREYVKVVASSRPFTRKSLEDYFAGGRLPFGADWGEALLPVRIADPAGPVLAKVGGGRDFMQPGAPVATPLDWVYGLQSADPFGLRIVFNLPGPQPVFFPGQKGIKIGVQPDVNCYVALLHRNPLGEVTIVKPGASAAGGQIDFFPPRNQGSLTVTPPFGVSEVRAVATLDAVNWNDPGGVYRYLAAYPGRWSAAAKPYQVSEKKP